MTAMDDDLTTWLRAQVDDDERVALAIQHDRYGDADTDEWKRWTIEHEQDRIWPYLPALGVKLAHSYADNVITPQRGEHIVRWDPARVLAEVDAKRRILTHWETAVYQERVALSWCIEQLAVAYADRPGYREQWRPSTD